MCNEEIDGQNIKFWEEIYGETQIGRANGAET